MAINTLIADAKQRMNTSVETVRRDQSQPRSSGRASYTRSTPLASRSTTYGPTTLRTVTPSDDGTGTVAGPATERGDAT